MKDLKVIEIDGVRYVVNQYLTSYGVKLLSEIVKLLGEPLIKLMTQAKDGLKTEIDSDDAASAIASLTEKLDEDTLDRLFKKILDRTLQEGSSYSVVQDYDTRFAGKYMHLFKLVFKTLEAQYSDFLGVIGELGRFSKEKAKK